MALLILFKHNLHMKASLTHSYFPEIFVNENPTGLKDYS